MDTYLEVKWTISRGRETYGYNICTVIDTTTGKRYRSMGGGYDMLGTSFGQWLMDVWGCSVILDVTDEKIESEHLYGITRRDGKVRVDGACGLESMRKIANVIRLDTRQLVNRQGHVNGFIVSSQS